MNIFLQISVIVALLALLGLIIVLLRKNALSLRYALLWIFSIMVMLVVSIFPPVLSFIADILGFEVASNALFSLLFAFVILIILSLSSIVSRQSEKIKTLAQTCALLEQRIRELEGKF